MNKSLCKKNNNGNNTLFSNISLNNTKISIQSITLIIMTMIMPSILVTGCAGVTTVPIGENGQTSDEDARGIRHYGYKVPFILVTPRVNGKPDSQLIYLADMTKKFSSRPYAFMANNEVSLDFTHGILGNSKEIVDETVVPTAMLKILKDLAEKVVDAAISSAGKLGAVSVTPDSVTPENTLPEPALFRIFVDKYGNLAARGKYMKQDIRIPSLSTIKVDKTSAPLVLGEK